MNIDKIDKEIEEKAKVKLCSKCVYHTSGSCSAWTCKGTVTVKSLQRETEYKLLDELIDMANSGINLNKLVSQMKAKKEKLA